jgi:hypothetical protein
MKRLVAGLLVAAAVVGGFASAAEAKTATTLPARPVTTARPTPSTLRTTTTVARTTTTVARTTTTARRTTTTVQTLSNANTYVNVDGKTVHSPARTSNGSPPAGASAQCRDGTYSFSLHRSGTCSGHGGVSRWL